VSELPDTRSNKPPRRYQTLEDFLASNDTSTSARPGGGLFRWGQELWRRPPTWLVALLMAIIVLLVLGQCIVHSAPTSPVVARPVPTSQVVATIVPVPPVTDSTRRPPPPASANTLGFIALAVLVFGWIRLLGSIGISLPARLTAGLVLAFVSYGIILELIGLILDSPLLIVAALLGLLVAGMIGPGAFLIRLVRTFVSRR
jgi:hypothetical protein